MPFPPDILTRTVSIGGAAVIESGRLLRIVAEIRSSKSLIREATGYRFESQAVGAVSADGSEITFELPRTDQPGWKDARTGSLIDVSIEGSYTHKYTAKVSFQDEQGRKVAGSYDIGPFVLPAGDGTIDLDRMVPASSTAGDAVLFPDWISRLVADAQQSAADAANAVLDSDAFVDATAAAKIADPTSETGAAMGARIAEDIADLTSPAGAALDAVNGATLDAALGVPTALAGVPLFGVGNSWVQSTANGRYIERMGDATGVASYANLGLNGARMQDTAANLVKEGTRKWESRLGGVVVVNDLLNNLIEADTPQNRAAALECLRATVALFSSSSRIETNTATNVSGFTSSTQAHASSGTLMQATAEGSRFDLAVPAAGDYYLLGHGANGLGWNTGSGTNWIGGIITVTQGAKTWTKDFDAIAQNTWLVVSNGFNPAVMKLPGLEAGTIRVTHSKGARANAISQIDVLLPMSTRPPLVVIVKPVTVTAASHNKPALFDYLRTCPDVVAAEFPNVLVADPEPGWDPASMLQADGLHPSAVGAGLTGAEYLARFVSREVAGEVNRRARRSAVASLI